MPNSVAIESINYDVFADTSMADEYMNAASHGDDWRVLDAVSKARLLVTATRVLNRQAWKGDKVDLDQPLAWPRTNTGITPAPTFDLDGVPVDINNAAIELALALAQGSDVQDRQIQADRVRSQSAGSVSISYFRGVDPVNTRFTQIVQELLNPYLDGGGTVFAAKVTGADCASMFPIELGVTGATGRAD